MKTTIRFDHAIRKLYTAFHNNALNPEDCKQCAVGNILDNNDSWRHLTDVHGSVRLNYIGLVHQNLARKFNGYSPIELLQIERSFLKGCGYRLGINYCHKPDHIKNKDILFNGLCEVVSKLCALDDMQDMMNCKVIFGYKNEIVKVEFV